MENIEIKRGDTFSLDVAWNDASGSPVDLTGMVLTSQAKCGDFAATLTVTVVNALLGRFRLSATATATAAWPVARISVDVKRDQGGGVIRRSETFVVNVKQEITT